MTSSAQNVELSKPVTRFAYFAEFQFASGTQYVSSFNIPITWGGHTWGGLGSVGSIGAIEESDALDAKSLSFSINIAQGAWLATSVGPVEEYRGLPAKLYVCPLDENFVMVGTPEICWRGLMDTVTVSIEGDAGSATLKCETSAYGLKRQQPLRINSAIQKKRHPGDTGLDYLTKLIAEPQLWLSVKFQKQ